MFFIRDKLSGQIIQGSDDEEVVTHQVPISDIEMKSSLAALLIVQQILLESSMQYELRKDSWSLHRLGGVDEGDGEWCLVDLDYWMEDSHFWAANKTGGCSLDD